MTRLAVPARTAPRHLGTIVGLLIGIALIAAAILLDRADTPRQTPPAHHSWVQPYADGEHTVAKLYVGGKP